jgi:hypothetical protein
MTKEQFKLFWSIKYPQTIPIPHLFKHDYPERWFRIHSLPESKRYPDNDKEWEILYTRQNTIITDLLGDNSKILIVSGDHYHEGYTELHKIEDVESIKQFLFIPLDHIDLYKISREHYEPGQVYRPIFCNEVWKRNKFNGILKDIAEDQLRAFFISIDHDTIVAPYDGGIDFVLKDSATRDSYKNKYQDWLSHRDDGL